MKQGSSRPRSTDTGRTETILDEERRGHLAKEDDVGIKTCCHAQSVHFAHPPLQLRKQQQTSRTCRHSSTIVNVLARGRSTLADDRPKTMRTMCALLRASTFQALRDISTAWRQERTARIARVFQGYGDHATFVEVLRNNDRGLHSRALMLRTCTVELSPHARANYTHDLMVYDAYAWPSGSHNLPIRLWHGKTRTRQGRQGKISHHTQGQVQNLLRLGKVFSRHDGERSMQEHASQLKLTTTCVTL